MVAPDHVPPLQDPGQGSGEAAAFDHIPSSGSSLPLVGLASPSQGIAVPRRPEGMSGLVPGLSVPRVGGTLMSLLPVFLVTVPDWRHCPPGTDGGMHRTDVPQLLEKAGTAPSLARTTPARISPFLPGIAPTYSPRVTHVWNSSHVGFHREVKLGR